MGWRPTKLKRALILLIYVVLLWDTVYGQDFGWYSTNMHPATFCIPCHQRFSERSEYAVGIPTPLRNPEVLTIFPCAKPGCHKYNKAIPLPTRWQLHLGICGNCHTQQNGTYEVHKIHLNFSLLQPPWELNYPTNQSIGLRKEPVECRICHQTPEGYNSSIASVPPINTSIPRLPGAVIKPPWKNDCAYCHPAVKGAGRLHDVHKPIIVQACPVCHTSKIFERQDYIYEVAGEKSLLLAKLIEIKEEFLLITEFRAYFQDIADQIIKIYLSFRGGESSAG